MQVSSSILRIICCLDSIHHVVEPQFCFEAKKSYKLQFDLTAMENGLSRDSSVLIDSVSLDGIKLNLAWKFRNFY